MPGPSPTPSSILEARGSWRGKARGDAGEPQDAVAAPEMPPGLPKAAREHWQWIVPRLLQRRTLAEVDLGLLSAMCVEWAEYMLAVADLEKLRKTRKAYKGHLIDHPRVRMKGSFERYSKAAMHFGLSPAAKSRVQVAGNEKPASGKSRFFSGPRLAGTA